MEIKSENLRKAATTVCRNPKHIPQAITILAKTLPKDGEEDVEEMVRHWWDKQLFLGINPLS